MRVLHIVHLFPPESEGGTQSYVKALAQSQLRAGDEVRVLCGSNRLVESPEIRREEIEGLDVSRLERTPAEQFSGDLGSPRLRDAVLQAARAQESELVHVHHWSGLSCDLVRSLSAEGFSVVVTLHDLYTTCARFFRMPDHRRFCNRDVSLEDCAACLAPDLAGFEPAAILAALEGRRLSFGEELGAAARVLTVSEAQRTLLLSLPGLEHQTLESLPIGVPRPIDATPSEARSPIEANRLVLGNWGGLDPRKGLHLVVDAIKLTPDPQAYRLEVWGGGRETHYGEEIAEAAEGLDIIFHGRYADEEMASFPGRIDLAVFPFLAFETYALVVDEALRLNLPVVVSDHGAPPERLGKSGLTFPNGDAAALAARLESLRLDPNSLNTMRKASHGARSFEAHCEALQSIYRSVIGA